jgi:hypothetical protein
VTWLFEDKQIENLQYNLVVFLYIITNKLSGRKYIGKKLSKFKKIKLKTSRLKNGSKKKTKIRYEIDSDWQTYYGSNTVLTEEVKNLGSHNFNRQILKYCYSKNELNYYEAKYQFDYGVLLSDDWYNEWISVKVRKVKQLIHHG